MKIVSTTNNLVSTYQANTKLSHTVRANGNPILSLRDRQYTISASLIKL